MLQRGAGGASDSAGGGGPDDEDGAGGGQPEGGGGSSPGQRPPEQAPGSPQQEGACGLLGLAARVACCFFEVRLSVALFVSPLPCRRTGPAPSPPPARPPATEPSRAATALSMSVELGDWLLRCNQGDGMSKREPSRPARPAGIPRI
jgi:hypothetical protein